MSIFCMFYKYFLFRNIFLQYKTTASSIGFLLTWYQCFAIDENLLHGGADTWRNNLLLFRGSKYETSIKFVNRVYYGECVISQNTSIGCIFFKYIHLLNNVEAVQHFLSSRFSDALSTIASLPVLVPKCFFCSNMFVPAFNISHLPRSSMAVDNRVELSRDLVSRGL